MTSKIIPIVYFVLAISIFGCQEHISSDSAVGIEDSFIETPQVDEKNNVAETAESPDENSPVVIAYYFHRTMRCPGCLEIEASAQRVIETIFEKQISDDKLMWIPLNLDEPGSEEFEKEFDVSVSTLVIAKVQDGNHTKYKKLEKVWDLIGDPVKFDSYIQDEVRFFLNE